jgi:trans-aconitate methyltransferase
MEWNAQEYAKEFSFVSDYGQSLVDWLDIQKGMTCLDLGCGTGSLTAILKQAGLQVIGMDASENQLQKARTDHPDLSFIKGNAYDFTLAEPIDVVFSNAVFHWIPAKKQIDMLNNIYHALKPQGQLVFEMGGKGNNALIHEQLKRAFERRNLTYEFPFYFPSIGEYTSLMESVGFEVRQAILFDRKTKLKGSLADWIRMFIQKPFEGLDPSETDAIIQEVVEALRPQLYEKGTWYADYVRLRCKASHGPRP